MNTACKKPEPYILYKASYKFLLICSISIAPLAFSSCGTSSNPVDGSDNNTQGKQNGGSEIKTITGVASAGPIINGTVLVYALNANGSRGSLLASTTTDNEGNYTLSVNTSGPVELAVKNGTYVDEATEETVVMGNTEMRSVLPSVSSTQVSSITTLTEMATSRAKLIASAANGSAKISEIVTVANAQAANLAGISDAQTPPITPTKLATDSTSEGAKYALWLAGVSKAAKENGIKNSLLMGSVLATDFQDGKCDGKVGTDAIYVPGNAVISGAPIVFPENIVNDTSVGITGGMQKYISDKNLDTSKAAWNQGKIPEGTPSPKSPDSIKVPEPKTYVKEFIGGDAMALPGLITDVKVPALKNAGTIAENAMVAAKKLAANLTQNLNDAVNKQDQYNKSAAEIHSNIDAMNSKLDDIKVKLASGKSKLASAQTNVEITELQAVVAELQSDVEKVQSEIDSAKVKFDTVKALQIQTKAAIDRINKDLSASINTIKKAQHTLDVVSKELKSTGG